MTVGHIMVRTVRPCRPTAMVRDAVREMHHANVGALARKRSVARTLGALAESR